MVLDRCKWRCKLGLEIYAISEEIKRRELDMTENGLALVNLEVTNSLETL